MVYTRSHEDMGRSTTDRLHKSVGKKDSNQKLRQDATTIIQIAAAKRGGKGNAEPGSLAYANMTCLSLKKEINLQARINSFKSSHRPEIKMLLNFPIMEAYSRSLCTEKTFVHRSSLVVEATSRLKEFDKKQELIQGIEHTPTLDLVTKLRAEEQAKALAMLESQRLEAEESRKDDIHLAGDLVQSITKSGIPQASGNGSSDDERHRTKSITGLDFQEEICASSSVYSSDDEDVNDLNKLAKAVAGLFPFEDLTSFHS